MWVFVWAKEVSLDGRMSLQMTSRISPTLVVTWCWRALMKETACTDWEQLICSDSSYWEYPKSLVLEETFWAIHKMFRQQHLV
jgi:hypothetical protein